MSTNEKVIQPQDEADKQQMPQMIDSCHSWTDYDQPKSANHIKGEMEHLDESTTARSSDENDVTEKFRPEVSGFEGDIKKSRNNKWLSRQNTMCVWYYDETLPDDAQREVQRELRSLFDYIQIFTDPDGFTGYLGRNFIVDNIIFIICGKSTRPLCHLAQQHQKCYDLYELNRNRSAATRSSLRSWRVIRNTSNLIEILSSTIMQKNYPLRPVELTSFHDSTSFHVPASSHVPASFHVPTFVEHVWSSLSIFDSDLKETDLSSMNEETLEFLLFQSLPKVLLDAKHDSYAFEEMFLRCRQHFKDKEAVLQMIDDLQKNYRSDQAINYYAQNTPLNQLVQEAFCMKDIELIFALRFYISDLHKQVIQAANKQHYHASRNTMILYRPLQLSKTDLQKLNDHIDCLISVNEFFSSTEEDTNGNVTSDTHEDQYICNILLKLYIDSTMTNKSSFVYLAEYGAISQNEVLFSTCSVWRLQSINQNNDKNWVVTLTLSNDFESYWSNFHDKLPVTCDLLTLADLCCRIEDYSAAQIFYHRLLTDNISDKMCQEISNKIAALSSKQHIEASATEVSFDQQRYGRRSAVINSDNQQASLKALYIENNSSSRLGLLNNIGIFYWKIGNYQVSRKSFEIALEQQGFPTDMSKVHCNMGQLERIFGDYDRAHMYLINAVNLSENDAYQNKYVEILEMIEAELAPKVWIKLCPNELTIQSRSQTWCESLEDSQDIIILCLNVDMSEKNQLSIYNIESFQDEFQFIARTLSIKDKTIYVIISLTMADYVIPLIHGHYCIETIYLYGSTEMESSFNWSSISEIITGPFADLNSLCDQITGNIKTKVARHLHWDQNGDIFTMVYTQQIKKDQCYDIKLSNFESQNEHIVIFHCEEQMLFQAEPGDKTSRLDQFTDLKECLSFIKSRSKSQIFLVISGNTVPLEIQSTFDYPQIHSIYFFRITAFKSPFNKRKVGGLFYKLIDLSRKLHNDIRCFQKQRFHTIQIVVCPKLNHDKTLIDQLSNEQIDFLTVQLFIDILLQIPVLEFTPENLITIYRRLPNKVVYQNIQSCIEELYKYYKKNNHFEQNIEFLHTISRFKQNNQNDLIALQEPLRNIQNRVFESPKILTSINVYLTKIISDDTLEMMQSNIGGYVNIGTFVLATKSLQTARFIARQVTNNSLTSVFFEIEVIRGTHLLNVDKDRVIFALGPVFELESINLGPDNVWYVKIKSADAKFQLLKEQLQIETGVHLSWLTYGNYLSFLNQVERGSAYYEYILEKPRARDMHRGPIYNNYGLMYTSIETEHLAKLYFDAASVRNKRYSPESSGVTSKDQLNVVPSTENMIFSITEIDLSTALGRIGMAYYKMNNHTKALEFYKKAFESATNQRYRQYYYQRILVLSKGTTNDPTDISVKLKASDTYVSTVKATDKQTFIGVWFHDNHLSTNQYEEMRLYLNHTFYYYQIFDNMMEFSRYIGRRQLLSKVFLIVSDLTLYPTLVKLVHKKQEIFEKVYVLAPENHTTDITISCFKTSCAKTLFEELRKDISQYNIEENALNIIGNEIYANPYFINSSRSRRIPSLVIIPDLNYRQITSIQHSTEESLKFLSFQAVIDIILGTSYNSTDLSDMWKTCHYLSMGDEVQLNLVEKLKTSYQANEVINYYTEHSYLSGILNQAFHTGNMKQIFEFRVYISDLHKKIKELDIQQEIEGTKSSINSIYFGTSLSESVLQQLMDKQGGLILFNGFLSTTLDFTIASMWTSAKQVATETRSVLFHLQIDKKMKQPYAVISQYSTKSDESEILFSCGTIWRIDSFNVDEKPCIIKLASCNESDSQVVELRKKYIQGNCTLMSLGDILCELGDDDEGEWFYRKMLEHESLDDKTCGNLYYKIGMIRYEKEEYLSALENLEKSAHLLQSSCHKVTETVLPRPLYMYNNESVLLTIYNNTGILFQKNGRYDEAVEQYQKALKEKGTSSELATVHNNLGLLYFHLGNYTTSKEHHEKASKLVDDSQVWSVTFKNNLKRTNDHLDHIANKGQKEKKQKTSIDKFNRYFDRKKFSNERPGDIVKFSLNEDDQTTNNAELSTNLNFRAGFENTDRNQNIAVLYIDIELFDEDIFSAYYVKSFDNPFKFIASTFSIKDKTIYLVISTNKSQTLIPIIHKHYCIEKIYLYGSIDPESSSTWYSMYEKIDDCYQNIHEIYDQIVKDIKEKMERQLRWDRSFDLFTMLHTQRSENQYSVIEVSSDIPHEEYIVIFHYDDRKLFHLDQKSIPASEFTDAKECAQFINQQTQSQIFLIIAGSMIPLEIQLLFGSRQIHAIYFFRHNEYKYPNDRRKVSGLFDKLEELSQQLHKDILFYREQRVHTARVDMFSSVEQTQKLIPQLSDKQIAFLISNLFVDVLPQAPVLQFKQEHLINICDLLFPSKGAETMHYFNQLYEDIDELNNLHQDPRFSQTVLRLHQLNQLNELFILQKPVVNIQKRVFESIKTSRTTTVYLTKMISNDTLDIVKSSGGEFISLGTFVLATKSFLTARTIARKVANNGLISVLFQIEVAEGTHLLDIDSKRVVFRLGAIFRLESTNSAPDGVYYAKVKPVESEFQLIKEQLQFEIGIQLSWLTFGNYLYILKESRRAKAYFEYLLDKLPSEHIDRASIYNNNMALIYTMETEEKEKLKAEKMYNEALNYVQADKSYSTISKYADQTWNAIPSTTLTLPKTSIDRSTVLGNIADAYYQNGNFKSALNYYKQALELSTDVSCRSHYQQMIVTIKFSDVWIPMVKATYKQTFIGIWFHNNTLPPDQQDRMKLNLNKTFYYYQIFNDESNFYGYIDEEKLVAKIFLIISTSDAALDSIVTLTQQYAGIFEKVYIFLPTKVDTSVCFSTNNLDDLFKNLWKDIQDYTGETNSSNRIDGDIYMEPISINTDHIIKIPPSLSVFNSKLKQSMPIRQLTKESLRFVAYLTMRDIILQESCGKNEVREMCITCREIYREENVELTKIDHLQEYYNAKEAIKYYTESSFLFRTINQVCRAEDVQVIFKFRVYISDLHEQLKDLHTKQQTPIAILPIEKIYRGKPLSGSVLQQLIDNQKSMISMNGFLSATSDLAVADMYAGDEEQIDKGHKCVHFEFKIDKKIKQPYADISHCSTKPDEAEILFSLGTIWRVESITHEKDLYRIKLTSCNELDSELAQLNEKFAGENVTFLSLGDVLLELGDETGADWSYHKMLDRQLNDDKTTGILYYKIGMIQFNNEHYSEALPNLIKAESLLRRSENESTEAMSSRPLYIHCSGSPLLKIYNNIGFMLEKNGKYDEALKQYQKALKENGTNPELAIVHNNIGLLYFHLGSYTESKEHHAKASELIDDSHVCSVTFKSNLKRTNDHLNHIANNEEKQKKQKTNR